MVKENPYDKRCLYTGGPYGVFLRILRFFVQRDSVEISLPSEWARLMLCFPK